MDFIRYYAFSITKGRSITYEKGKWKKIENEQVMISIFQWPPYTYTSIVEPWITILNVARLHIFLNRLQCGRGATRRAGQSDYPGAEKILLPTFPSATGGQFTAG